MSPARRLWLIAPWAIFVMMAASWVFYWHYLADRAEAELRAWAAAQTEQGAQASFSRIVRRGFPTLMRLEVHELAFAPARGGWRAHTGRADLHIDLLNPSHVIASGEAPIEIAREGDRVSVLDAAALIASLETRAGNLVMAGIEADRLTLDDPAGEGVLRVAKLVVNVRPDPRAAGDYQAAFEARALSLPRPVRSFEQFGLDVAQLRAAIVLTHGARLLDTAPGDPLAPWRDAGGRARFEALALAWGPLEADGSGEGGLDEARRLSGHLTLPIARPGPIFSALANGPRVDDSARRALALLAAGFAVSGDSINLDIDAGDGVLRLEGLPVRTLPPVY
jgi:hypothetical protein